MADLTLHPTALKVLRAVAVTEGRGTNHLEWIAEEAGVSDSTARRWLRRMEEIRLVGRYVQNRLWDDRYVYWEVCWRGAKMLSNSASEGER